MSNLRQPGHSLLNLICRDVILSIYPTLLFARFKSIMFLPAGLESLGAPGAAKSLWPPSTSALPLNHLARCCGALSFSSLRSVLLVWLPLFYHCSDLSVELGRCVGIRLRDNRFLASFLYPSTHRCMGSAMLFQC